MTSVKTTIVAFSFSLFSAMAYAQWANVQGGVDKLALPSGATFDTDTLQPLRAEESQGMRMGAKPNVDETTLNDNCTKTAGEAVGEAGFPGALDKSDAIAKANAKARGQ